MGKLSGKKLLLLGERDGVPGPAMADVFANSGAEVLGRSHLRRALGWSPVGTLRVSCA